jgi:hypothetical protein
LPSAACRSAPWISARHRSYSEPAAE